MRRLCWEYGNWPLIETFRQEVLRFVDLQERVWSQISSPDPTTRFSFQKMRVQALGLLSSDRPESIIIGMARLDTLTQPDSLRELRNGFESLKRTWTAVQEHPARWRTFVPWVTFHGFDNRYFDWLEALLFRFDLGKNQDKGNAIDGIKNLLPVTMMFTGLGILFALLFSIPLAIWSVTNVGKKRERAFGIGLFVLDSIPAFWMALLLWMALANPDHQITLFPGSYEPNAPFWGRIHSMILPLFAYTYGSLAFLTRTLRGSLLEIQREPYIKTAIALGYSPRQILWRHSLRPALLPLITVIGTVFPAMVGGSVILEKIFIIHGLGETILKATMNNDPNIILAVFTLSGLLTLVGYFVSDLLYTWADPRIRFQQDHHKA